MATSPPQLFLLADHIRLALLERQRAVSLSLPSTTQHAHISRSLGQLRSGIEALESHVADVADESITSQLPRLRTQLRDLTSQFTTPSRAPDTPAALPSNKPRPSNKSVRFTDAPEPEDANRRHLFPYRDHPAPDPDAAPDHSHLDNQQIHQYHSQVLAAQDSQLDQLGLSIGRQRELSMQIGDELDGHVLLLDDVDEGVDRHQAQFGRARRRLDSVGRKARENWSCAVIVGLICLLVFLIVITK